jgi:hypothetical protein
MTPWHIENTDGSTTILDQGSSVGLGVDERLPLKATVDGQNTLYLSVFYNSESIFFESIHPKINNPRVFNTVEALATGISNIVWVPNKKKK